MKNEYEVVSDFTHKIGLNNQTDGTVFIYKNKEKMSKKPDGYYFLDGTTFILDAKAEGKKFTGQLEDYMKQEANPNFIGFKYNGNVFQCYVKGKLIELETEIKHASYYVETYFPNKITLPDVVSKNAKILANRFRNSGINKQYNVPFIGAVMLCFKYKYEINIDSSTTSLLNSIKDGIEKVIEDEPISKKEKKTFLKSIFDDDTLQRADNKHLVEIVKIISNTYNFINVSERSGKDTMNAFLKVFRRWNSSDSQEKGEVFTPDHIAEVMIKLINLNHNDTVLDPTCGSGTFLTNAMFEMINQTDDLDKKKRIKERQIIGIEIDSFNSTLACINMLLHGDGSSQIYKDSCFSKLPLINSTYNKVLMNPPFSQSTPELDYVEAALDNCQKGGLVASIIPLTVISELKNHQILNKHKIRSIVKLNRQVFLPSAAVWTGIVVFEAHSPHNNEDYIKSYNFENDGYELRRGQHGRIKTNNVEFKFDNFNNVKITDSDLFFFEKKNGKITFTQEVRSYCSSLLLNGIKDEIKYKINNDVEGLDNSNWKSFEIRKIFKNLSSGKEKNSINDGSGTIFVSAKKINEGIAGFKSHPNKVFKCDEDNVLLAVVTQGDGGSGITYPKSYDFCASNTIRVLEPINFKMNIYTGLFIAKCCSVEWYKKYGHGNVWNFENEFVRLPTDNNGNPDYKFMEQYIKNIMVKH